MISILFRHYILQVNNILSIWNLNPCGLEKKYEKTKITEHVLGEKANIAVICKIAKKNLLHVIAITWRMYFCHASVFFAFYAHIVQQGLLEVNEDFKFVLCLRVSTLPGYYFVMITV